MNANANDPAGLMKKLKNGAPVKQGSIVFLFCIALSVFAQDTVAMGLKQAEQLRVKNVIVLIADGMSNDGVTLTRWYNAYDPKTNTFDVSYTMAMDELASGLTRTYWMNNGIIGGITDSAPAATAMATGVKTNNKYIGVSDKKLPLATILEVAKLNGKKTGLISTSAITHATPAAYSSHYPDRSKEEVIAEQQVYNDIDVIFGGGRARLENRADKENLIAVLKENGYAYITTSSELSAANGKVWGLFANIAMAYDIDRAENTPDEPTLAEMTQKAIEILSQGDNGFFLMVEASKIDWASHANEPIGLISDINAYDKAIEVALNFAKKNNDTMLLIVSDHGNGGITIGNSATDNTYANAPLLGFIAPLKKAKLSGEGLEQKFDKDRTNIVEVMSSYYGISDLSKDEVERIKNAKAGKMLAAVGPMISQRASIGWTTRGHTGEDIVLYSYLPNNERVTGVIENTDIATLSAKVFGTDLGKVTNTLYVDANAQFAAKGAKATVDNATVGGTQLIVTKGKNKLTIFENKNFVLLNGKKVKSNGINVNIYDKFYVSKSVIDLID